MDRMEIWRTLEKKINAVLLDPKYHDIFMLIKSVRNGFVYGTKVRFPHALVMIFLFRHGTIRQKCKLVYKATRQHARNLGFFALAYKSSMLLLKAANGGKEGHFDTFLAGLVGGYTVFGRDIQNPVSQQIVIYVFARVALAVAKLAVQPRGDVGQSGLTSGNAGGASRLIWNEELRLMVLRNAWPAFASLSWACVMYLFRWHPETVQPSLRSSMNYIYVKSDHWDSLRNFIWHNE